tara:strand:- start:457 stop:864 length:408 start_codon:yes stop_codon:yes gene_type:complete
MKYNNLYIIMISGAYDINSCCISCGYSFCEALNTCIRSWETLCPDKVQQPIINRRLTSMDDFSIDQLMLFIGGVFGALASLLLVIQKSKCKHVNCCCIKCERDVDAIIKEEKLKLTGHSGETPRLEPEPEMDNQP